MEQRDDSDTKIGLTSDEVAQRFERLFTTITECEPTFQPIELEPLQVATWKVPQTAHVSVTWEPTEEGKELLETMRLVPKVGQSVRLVCGDVVRQGTIAKVNPDGTFEVEMVITG